MFGLDYIDSYRRPVCIYTPASQARDVVMKLAMVKRDDERVDDWVTCILAKYCCT